MTLRRVPVVLIVLSVTAVALLTLLHAQAQGPAATPAAPVATAGDLHVLKTLTIGGDGRWDFISIDPTSQRLYVPRSTRVAVIDADKGTVIGEVSDTPGVHAAVAVPELNLGFSTNGRENMLGVFDLKTLKTSRKIKTGRGPDAILYEPVSKKIISVNHGGGDLTIVDPAALDKDPVTVTIGGALEVAVSDGNGHLYVNVEDKNEVAIVDLKEMKVTARWPLAPGEGPTGLAIDVAHHRLFSGCGNQKMIVLDSETGKVLATVPIGKGVDGVAFDPEMGGALSANGGDGTITVVRETKPGEFTVVATVPTIKGARTITVEPTTHRAYLPCTVPAAAGATAPGGTTFGVVVVGRGEQPAK